MPNDVNSVTFNTYSMIWESLRNHIVVKTPNDTNKLISTGIRIDFLYVAICLPL